MSPSLIYLLLTVPMGGFLAVLVVMAERAMNYLVRIIEASSNARKSWGEGSKAEAEGRKAEAEGRKADSEGRLADAQAYKTYIEADALRRQALNRETLPESQGNVIVKPIPTPLHYSDLSNDSAEDVEANT